MTVTYQNKDLTIQSRLRFVKGNNTWLVVPMNRNVHIKYLIKNEININLKPRIRYPNSIDFSSTNEPMCEI